MPYKVGFRLDNDKKMWLTETYSSKSDAERVMKKERASLLAEGIPISYSFVAEILWGVYATIKKSYDYHPKKGWYNKYGTFVPEEGLAQGYRTKKEAIETMNILSQTTPEYKYEVKEVKKLV